MLVKRLTPVGNSLGLIIDRPILQLLNIDRDTELEIRTDGEVLTLRPVRRARREVLEALSEEIMEEHAETFRELAR